MRFLNSIGLALTGALVLAGCEASAPASPLAPSLTSADRTYTTSYSQQLYYLMQDPCSPEYILIQGPLHYVTQFSVDKDGGVSARMNTNYAGVTGMGLDPVYLNPTGPEYIIAGAEQTYVDLSFDGAEKGRGTETMVIVSKGDRPNNIRKAYADYTIDAQGNITELRIRASDRCVG